MNETNVDCRLENAWQQTTEMDFPLNEHEAFSLIRMAYGLGYVDSLSSEKPEQEAQQLGLQ